MAVKLARGGWCAGTASESSEQDGTVPLSGAVLKEFPCPERFGIDGSGTPGLVQGRRVRSERMPELRKLLRTVGLIVASVVTVAVFALWATRPAGLPAPWVAALEDPDKTPGRIVLEWCRGERAPRTVTGLLSLFA